MIRFVWGLCVFLYLFSFSKVLAHATSCHEAKKFVFFASTYSYDTLLACFECGVLNMEEDILHLEHKASKSLQRGASNNLKPKNKALLAPPFKNPLKIPNVVPRKKFKSNDFSTLVTTAVEVRPALESLSQKRQQFLYLHQQQYKVFERELEQRQVELQACQVWSAAQDVADQWAQRFKSLQRVCTRKASYRVCR